MQQEREAEIARGVRTIRDMERYRMLHWDTVQEAKKALPNARSIADRGRIQAVITRTEGMIETIDRRLGAYRQTLERDGILTDVDAALAESDPTD